MQTCVNFYIAELNTWGRKLSCWFIHLYPPRNIANGNSCTSSIFSSEHWRTFKTAKLVISGKISRHKESRCLLKTVCCCLRISCYFDVPLSRPSEWDFRFITEKKSTEHECIYSFSHMFTKETFCDNQDTYLPFAVNRLWILRLEHLCL